MHPALRLRLITKDPTTKMTCFWHELQDINHCYAREPKEIQLFVDGWGRAFLSKDKSNVRGSIPRSLAQEAYMLTLTPPKPKTRTAPFEICFI